jgi:hypothetical protein
MHSEILTGKMVVEQYDAPTRYTVTSETKPGVVYIVDLAPEEYDHPVCTCDDFRCRHQPVIQRGQPWKRHHCKHIEKVVDELKWILIDTMIEIERDRNKT